MQPPPVPAPGARPLAGRNVRFYVAYTMPGEGLACPAALVTPAKRPPARAHVARVSLHAGSDVEATTGAKPASMQRDEPQAASTSQAPPASAAAAAAAGPPGAAATHVALQHCAVHWVKADARLAGALARSARVFACMRSSTHRTRNMPSHPM